MSVLPNCPECDGSYVYEDGNLLICPECAHEWTPLSMEIEEAKNLVYDSANNVLSDGDSGTFARQVKYGSNSVIRQGTKVSDIRIEENGPHNIVARVEGIGLMELKSELIKKR